MLSRIAESLFWIGRYVERAEDTARILDVQMQLLIEDAALDEDSACRSLLNVMGVEHEGRALTAKRGACGTMCGMDLSPGYRELLPPAALRGSG